MLRDATNEIRLHPGRFIATLLSIAISVAFIAAISTLVGTEQQSMARFTQLPVSKADIVVSGDFDDPSAVQSALEGVDGVTAVAAASSTVSMLTHEDKTVFVTFVPVPREEFRWASIAEGRWPASSDEVAMSSDGLKQLRLSVGDTVRLEGQDQPATIVGRTNDPKAWFGVTGYTAPAEKSADTGGPWVLRTAGDPAALLPAVSAALPDPMPGGEVDVSTGDDARAAALNDLTGNFDVFRSLLLGFAGVALVVGIITISNTFTILVAQRRRQIGLLRAVGASTGQVRGRLVWEALLLGVVGSLLGIGVGVGVAALGASITGSIFWGLVLRPVELLAALAVGVIATLLSVVGPSFVATRVSPVEALQAVPSASRARRLSITRAVVCALFGAGGVALVVMSRLNTNWALVWAMGAGFLLSIAILGAAPFYIPALLRLLGRVLGFTGPTTRLAATNAARNPQRAAATAVALMLAVGLVVTIQVAVSTVRTTGVEAINQRFPIDLTLTSQQALPVGFTAKIRGIADVATAVEVSSKNAEINDYPQWAIRSVNPARAELDLPADLGVSDGTIIIGDYGFPAELELPGVAGPVTLQVKTSENLNFGVAAVSEATFEKLAGNPVVTELWVKLTDRTSATALNQVSTAATQAEGDIQVEGGAFFAGILQQVLDVVLIVLTALLGVAVVIALVGVGNTLGLSVIERQRESALLRALGMQRAGLRLMLLVEALMLALVGTVVGIAAGAFFGWLGVSSAVMMMPATSRTPLYFSVDVGLTALLVAVCLAAACLASVLPGRRAANATPTEALAVE
ncbi:FtsX-like permease family protein [Tessaracoccus antarcticus]|uniref:FtsX-like permease family protein n=1 Tax=Tessaracoccus antarcticus TaxID=2479848 RepID=A0A3M0GCG4_9ACTN|nr:FtsX-like permease family protein [Tessaracoccus antarcticus]RMB62177.1 FtsX-like permease family protein [Tessaracoccus antarcticus]